MSKTTIQLKDTTKDKLDELKRVDGESYESVVLMLIANYNNPQESNGMNEEDIKNLIDRRVDERLEELRR